VIYRSHEQDFHSAPAASAGHAGGRGGAALALDRGGNRENGGGRLFPRRRAVRAGGRGNRTDVTEGAAPRDHPRPVGIPFQPPGSGRRFRRFGAAVNLDADTYLHPDILVHPIAILTPDVRGGDVLLAVEVADSSLPYDLNTKAPIYADYGVREYWVINAVTLTTMVHRQPSGKTWGFVDEVAPGGTLSAFLLPAFSVSLGTLELHLD
jgi:hypothetical protein